MTNLERARAELARAELSGNAEHGEAAKAFALVSIAESLENIVFVLEERIVGTLDRIHRATERRNL